MATIPAAVTVGVWGFLVCLGLVVATFLHDRRARHAAKAAAATPVLHAATVPCAAE